MNTINITIARPAASLLNLKLADVLVLVLSSHRRKNVLSSRRQRRAVHGGVTVAVRKLHRTQRAAARGAVREINPEAVARLKTSKAGIYEVELHLKMAPLLEILRQVAIITPNVIILIVGEVSGRRRAL